MYIAEYVTELHHGIELQNYATESYYRIILPKYIMESYYIMKLSSGKGSWGSPGSAEAPWDLRGRPGHAPGTSRDALGTPRDPQGPPQTT